MAEITIKAPLKNTYKVLVENNFDKLADCMEAADCLGKKICIVCDAKVWGHYGDNVAKLLSDKAANVISYIVKDEDCCTDLNFDSLTGILEDAGFDDDDILIGLGGRNLCDYTGKAVANSTKHLGLAYIPTSLASMADSTSVSIPGAMQDIRPIVFPKFVYCNTFCLETLSDKDYFSGFSLIMKTAIVKNANIYEWLVDKLYEISDRDNDIISDMIEQNINLRRIYLEKDPNRKSEQLLLDLGIDFAKCIEKAKDYELSFGECLSLGIIAAAHISMKRDMLSLDEYLEIRDMFVPFNLPITIENIDVDALGADIIENTYEDENGKCFVLLKKIGKAVIDRNVTLEEVTAALSEIRFSDDDYVVE